MMTAINADDENMVMEIMRSAAEELTDAARRGMQGDDDLDYIPSAMTIYHAAYRAISGWDATTDPARSIAALAHNLRTCGLIEGDGFPHPWEGEVRCIHDEAFQGNIPEECNEWDACPHFMTSPNS